MQPPATASPLLLFLSPQTTALHHKQFQFPCSWLIRPWHFSLPLPNFCQPSPPHPVSLSPDCSLLLPLINSTKLPFNIVSPPAVLRAISLTLKLSSANPFLNCTTSINTFFFEVKREATRVPSYLYTANHELEELYSRNHSMACKTSYTLLVFYTGLLQQ